MAENVENKVKKYKVNLGELCKTLNRLSGGAKENFTGYFCKLYPMWSFSEIYNREALLAGEKDKEKFIRNCTLNFSVAIARNNIVPLEYGVVEDPHPAIYFDKMSVCLCDKLSGGDHVYDHIITTEGEQESFRYTISPQGVDVVKLGSPKMVRLSDRFPANQITITITDDDIEKQRTDESKTILREAIKSLESSKAGDGGRVGK